MKILNMKKLNCLIIFLVLILSSCIEHEDQEVQTYITSSHENAVNIIFLGDGYIVDDLLVNGEYENVGKEMIDLLLSKPPFSQYKEYFNAYIVYAESNERGADSDPAIEDKDTIFDATYGTRGIARLLTIQNTSRLSSYVALAAEYLPHKDRIIIVMVNDARHGGSGGNFSTISKNQNSKNTLIHEIGHSFGGLADEYVDEEYAALMGYTPSDAGSSLRPNVDDTGDFFYIKWKTFIGYPGYDEVGAYEGGYYFAEGVWRPEYTSVMRDSYAPFYNAPSRCRIYSRIMDNTGQDGDLMDFFERDAAAAGVSKAYKSNVTDEEILNPVPVELYYNEITKEYLYD